MKDKMKSQNTYPYLLSIASSIGLVAAFWQAVERINMLKNPTLPLSCNLNPVVDCGGVLSSKLAAIFGPPNAFIGMVAFAVLLAFGLQRLWGGLWTKQSQKIVISLSVIMVLFSAWFFAVSLYSIGKICIFCIFIWAASMPLGVYGAKDFLESLDKPKQYLINMRKFLEGNHLAILITIYLTMIAMFIFRFRNYYFG